MEQKKQNYAVPIAIVIAGALIAGSLYLSNTARMGSAPAGGTLAAANKPQGQLDAVAPISDSDHVRGNVNAPVKIVEYSDFECPFCKRFHGVMSKVMDEYGKTGKVAWVYRHAPLDALHPVKSRIESAASECAAELGGKDMFWSFADTLFERTLSNNRTDLAILPEIAEDIGLNRAAFSACVKSGKYDQHIEDNLQEFTATGGRGTPWSILIAPNGTKYPINGAQTYGSVKRLIELALKQK